MASRVSVATRRAVIRRFTAISLFAVLLLAPTAADAALIHIDSMAGFGPGLVPELSSGGQRLEIVGYSRIFDNPCNNCPIPLAVGDTLVVDVFFNFTVLMSDTIGFDEMFRAYLVGNPSNSNPDVSSVIFSSRVSLATENGPLSFDMQAGGLRQVSELQSSSVGDMVPTGAPSLRIEGFKFEMTILGDPQGVLGSALWPGALFQIDAASLEIDPNGRNVNHPRVPEPGTLWLLGLGGALLIRRRRGLPTPGVR